MGSFCKTRLGGGLGFDQVILYLPQGAPQLWKLWLWEQNPIFWESVEEPGQLRSFLASKSPGMCASFYSTCFLIVAYLVQMEIHI